jgi:hypothetical protein
MTLFSSQSPAIFSPHLKGHGTGTGNANANPIASPRTGGHAAFGNRVLSPHAPIHGHGSGSGNWNGNSLLHANVSPSVSFFSTHQTINVQQTGSNTTGVAVAALVGGAAVAAGIYAVISTSGTNQEEKPVKSTAKNPYTSTLAAQMMDQKR